MQGQAMTPYHPYRQAGGTADREGRVTLRGAEQSMTAIARRLGVSYSAVSRRVSAVARRARSRASASVSSSSSYQTDGKIKT